MMTDREREAFDEIVADLNFGDDPVEMDYSTMEKHELLEEFTRCERLLGDHKALIHPETEEDQDLQGRYYGLLTEMRKRGMR